jgi:low temperature requirement protein LtrA
MTTMAPLTAFFYGAIGMGCAVAGLFFLRFWRATRDRLFVYFAAAFWAMAVERVLFVVLAVHEDTQHLVFLVRLAAFLLIIAAIVDKNRER